jgi:hypothetical protein
MPKISYETIMLRLTTCISIQKLIKDGTVSNEKDGLKFVMSKAHKQNLKTGFEKGNSNRTFDRYLKFKKNKKDISNSIINN